MCASCRDLTNVGTLDGPYGSMKSEQVLAVELWCHPRERDKGDSMESTPANQRGARSKPPVPAEGHRCRCDFCLLTYLLAGWLLVVNQVVAEGLARVGTRRCSVVDREERWIRRRESMRLARLLHWTRFTIRRVLRVPGTTGNHVDPSRDSTGVLLRVQLLGAVRSRRDDATCAVFHEGDVVSSFAYNLHCRKVSPALAGTGSNA